MYTINYWPAADDALSELEKDPAKAEELRAVDRTLLQLAEDPFNPRLGTTMFMTEPLGGINATPTAFNDWYIIWQRSPEPGEIAAVQIVQLHLT